MSLPYEYLVPYDCDTLTKVRLGQDGDGGYLIPKEVIADTDILITFGVNDEDSFEQDFYKRRSKESKRSKTIPFYLCDPFATYSKKNEFMFLPLGLAKDTSGSMISFKDFLRVIRHTEETIFLKIDIEHAEWDAFETIMPDHLNKVHCLTIEFHGLLEHQDQWQKFNAVLEKINNLFHLYHIHGNNNGFAFIIGDKSHLPDVIECTYINRKWAEKNGHTFKRRTEPFPDALDQTNYAGKQDFILAWFLSS